MEYERIEFVNFVVVTSEGVILGNARENGDGRACRFIIKPDSVQAYNDTGQWCDVDPDLAAIIRRRAEAAYARVPTYHRTRFLIE